VLTTFGGDVLMWSSNGNLDAGRGSKTIVSAPALQAVFDQNDYESIDPGGYVTGSGIGTVQASSTVPPGQLYLLTPRGVIDFNTAGVRASGSAVFAAPVILNSSNYQVQGTTTGIPVVAVPVLSPTTAPAPTTPKPSEVPTETCPGADPRNCHDRASIFIVEVVSYGGGDGQNQPSNGGESQNQPSGRGDQRPDAKTMDEKR
jgi:hypothetical protein